MLHEIDLAKWLNMFRKICIDKLNLFPRTYLMSRNPDLKN